MFGRHGFFFARFHFYFCFFVFSAGFLFSFCLFFFLSCLVLSCFFVAFCCCFCFFQLQCTGEESPCSPPPRPAHLCLSSWGATRNVQHQLPVVHVPVCDACNAVICIFRSIYRALYFVYILYIYIFMCRDVLKTSQDNTGFPLKLNNAQHTA